MEVWKIANSPYAPKFQIVAQPNNWAKAVKKASTQNKLSETKLLQLEFWNKFKEFAQEHNRNIKLHKTSPRQYYGIRFGFPNAFIVFNC